MTNRKNKYLLLNRWVTLTSCAMKLRQYRSYKTETGKKYVMFVRQMLLESGEAKIGGAHFAVPGSYWRHEDRSRRLFFSAFWLTTRRESRPCGITVSNGLSQLGESTVGQQWKQEVACCLVRISHRLYFIACVFTVTAAALDWVLACLLHSAALLRASWCRRNSWWSTVSARRVADDLDETDSSRLLYQSPLGQD